MEINREKLQAGDCLEVMKVAYLMNPGKVQEAFEKVKIQVKEEKDLEILSKIVKSKYDVNGMFSDPEDEKRKLVFDTMRIFEGFKFSDEEKSICQQIKEKWQNK